MTVNLTNPEYQDTDFLMAEIARESPTFSKNQQESLIKDTDSEINSNSVWLGVETTKVCLFLHLGRSEGLIMLLLK